MYLLKDKSMLWRVSTCTQISPIDREKERVWIVLGATGLHLHFNSLKVIFWLKGLTGSKLQLLFGWLVAIS